jgi:uncharacterized protein (DUF2126 family)
VKEAELPANTSPTDPQLDDPEVRQRFMRTFQRGLTKPVGYVLPVQRWHAAPSRVTRWQSERWKVRRGALYAVPGDSALGYRLPLGSLPFVPPSDYPYTRATPPSRASRWPISARKWRSAGTRCATRRHRPAAEQASIAVEGPATAQRRIEQVAIEGAVRTALTVEPKDGYLSVFLPPVESLDDYLDLIAAVEQVAEETRVPVRIEAIPRRPIRA